MGASASLLPELEEVVQHGSAEKRAETLRRITGLFLDGAPRFSHAPCRAVRRRHRLPDRGDRGEGAGRARAPHRAGRRTRRPASCARSPIMTTSRWPNRSCAERGSRKPTCCGLPKPRARRICWLCRRAGASARRCPIFWSRAATARSRARSPPTMTRGCRSSAFRRWSIAPSRTTCWPRRSRMRTDIPPRLFRQLMMQASEVVQKRLLAQAKPETQAEIRRILAKVTDEVAAKAAPHNYAIALAAVRTLHQAAQARRSRRRRIRQGRQIRGDHRGAGDAMRGAGRSGRPADERRARRSGADPGARRRLRLADGARDHQRRGRRAEPARARRSKRRAKISSGSPRRPRSASCASGRCGRAR